MATAAALWDARFHVVPAAAGQWRGLSDPPAAARLAISLLLGVAGAAVLARAPRCVRTPVLALALAASPLVPVLTGRLLPLLALQGPVLLLLAGVVAAVMTARLALERPRDRAPADGTPRAVGALSPALLFVTGFAFFAFLSTSMPGAAGPQGDEPHYLLLAHSLLTDGDADLADEIAGRDYAAFFAGDLEPHTSVFSPSGKAYTIHGPGLPALVLPAYAIDGYTGVKLFLCALAALAALLVHRVVRDALHDEALAAAAWAALVFTPPLPFYAMRVYPETPAVLATAVFLRTSRGRPGWGAAGLAALTAALLPWLHAKFLLLGGLGLAFTLLRPCLWRVRAACVVLPALSVAALLVHFHALFGHATLSGGFERSGLSASLLPRGTAAVLLDRQFGLLAVSPLWALAVPGAVALFRWRAGDALRAGLLALLPIAVAGSFVAWWGGACPPARYVLPAVPALALLLAPALRQRPSLAAALGGLGLAVIGLAADTPRILHNRADGESLLLRFVSPSLDLNGSLPSFFEPGRVPVILALALAGAAALAWRWRRRGLLAGAALFVLLAAALRDRPWIDQRLATLQVLWEWQPGRLRGPQGMPDLRALALPLELPRAPWVLDALERRNSRRMDVPPGYYTLELSIVPLAAPSRVHVEMGTGVLPLAEAELEATRPLARLPVLLPAGARQMGITAVGVEGRARLEQARLVPEVLVPRDRRDGFRWPEYGRPDRYRVGTGRVRATALDRSAHEGDGFRLQGEAGEFLVDGPTEATAQVEVQRPRPAPTDVLDWGGRRIALGPHGEVALHLALAEGVPLGPAAVVPVRLRAEGAWIRVSEAVP